MAKTTYIIIGIIIAIILVIGGYLLIIPGSEETNCSLYSGDELQQCCNQWAQENNIITPACVGYWEIQSGQCSWKCESSEQNISEKSLAENITEANNELAFDLYSRYKNNEGNLFYSPYSISSALTMTYEGAKGQTADEMQEVLHLPDNKQQVREGYLSFYNEINKADKSYKLSTANALWAQEDYPFEQDYFDIVNQYYNGKVTNLDFKRIIFLSP
jgi:serpin B